MWPINKGSESAEVDLNYLVIISAIIRAKIRFHLVCFGCNVGAMLSGISTGSVHGWIWVALAFAGTLIGIRLRRRFGFD